MDVHVPAGITRALRRRGVDVLTAQEDATARFLDPELLDRAAEHGRIVFTRDTDFLAEGVRRQRAGFSFATIVYAHQQDVSIGRCVDLGHGMPEAVEAKGFPHRYGRSFFHAWSQVSFI